MKKVVGYIIAIVGLVGLVVSAVPSVREAVFGVLPDAIYDGLGVSLLVLSLIVLAVGVVILFISNRNSGQQKKKEVPIYRGKEIVGYRQE